jgi:hypothetical protein
MTNETAKNNDKQPALRLIQGGRTDDVPRTQPAAELTQSERDLNTFMTIAQAVAIEETKLMPTMREVERDAQALVEFAKAKLAELDAADAQKASDDAR